MGKGGVSIDHNQTLYLKLKTPVLPGDSMQLCDASNFKNTILLNYLQQSVISRI